jgi:DNA replication protein DnaC
MSTSGIQNSNDTTAVLEMVLMSASFVTHSFTQALQLFNFKNCEYKADTSTYQMEDTSQATKNYHCSCSSEFFSGSTSIHMSQMWYPNTVKWAQVLQA